MSTILLASITGSIITSTILKPVVLDNETDIEEVLPFCGVNDCNELDNPNLEEPDSETVRVYQLFIHKFHWLIQERGAL